MTGEKRTETRMRCYNTLCIPYISLHDPPYSHIQCMHAGRGGVIYIGNTQSVIASHSCFCSFFTSHPYILSKYLQNVFIY